MAQKRAEMIADTRAKLIVAARHAFATKGYADTAMEDLTAAAGLTRGALYHHFGGKKGLLKAVIDQIDAEMAERLRIVIEAAPTVWDGFVAENVAWLELALEPEIQRIVLLDGPAALGDRERWGAGSECHLSTRRTIDALLADKIIAPVDPDATAHLVNGAVLNAALWIANADEPAEAATDAVASLRVLLDGLLL